MSKVLIIIGIILALAGAGLAFVNYQAKNELVTELDSTKGTLATTESNLKAETEAKQAVEQELATTKTQLADTETKVAAEVSAKEALQSELTTTKSALADAETKITSNTAEIERLTTEVTKGAELATQVATLQSDVQTITAERDQLRVDLDQARTQVASANAPAGGPAGAPGAPAGITPPGLSGRVQAVNAGWSFVVLNVGEKDGVTPNAVMDVYRNNAKVGQVKVSSVEPTLSTANIVDLKDPAGSIEPGDRVITRS